jgi:hypothetical protein
MASIFGNLQTPNPGEPFSFANISQWPGAQQQLPQYTLPVGPPTSIDPARQQVLGQPIGPPTSEDPARNQVLGIPQEQGILERLGNMFLQNAETQGARYGQPQVQQGEPGIGPPTSNDPARQQVLDMRAQPFNPGNIQGPQSLSPEVAAGSANVIQPAQLPLPASTGANVGGASQATGSGNYLDFINSQAANPYQVTTSLTQPGSGGSDAPSTGLLGAPTVGGAESGGLYNTDTGVNGGSPQWWNQPGALGDSTQVANGFSPGAGEVGGPESGGFLSQANDFLGSKSFKNGLGLLNLGVQGYGMFQQNSLMQDQLGLARDQFNFNRDNYNTEVARRDNRIANQSATRTG